MNDVVRVLRRRHERCGRHRGLDWVVLRKEAFASRLPRDHALRSVRVRPRLDARTHATVVVADEHASLFIDGGVEEVEQVARHGASLEAARADSVALDWIAGRGINGRPGLAAVEGRGDVEIPD